MDWVPLIYLAAFLSTGFVMIGLMALVEHSATRHQLRAWSAALEHLRSTGNAGEITYDRTWRSGLAWFLSDQTFRASTTLNGLKIDVEFWTRRVKNRGIVCSSTVVAHLSPLLDLGLTVRRGRSDAAAKPGDKHSMGAWLDSLTAAFDPRGLPTGDWELDRRFHFWAREPKRLRALMNSDVRRGLLGAAGTVDVSVTDTEVRFEHRGVMHPELALWMIHDAAWLARAIVEAARHVPPSAWALHCRPVFEHAARALGLRYTLAPPMLGGMLGGVAVQCALIPGRVEDPPGLRLHAAFPRPLGLGLHLRPAQDGGLGLLRARDVELGDRLLDDKLDVHGDHPAAIQVLFDAEARALLHHLRDRGRVYVDDAGIRLESFGSADPRDLLPSLERICALARLLTHRRAGLATA